jgi:hypothetical protein
MMLVMMGKGSSMRLAKEKHTDADTIAMAAEMLMEVIRQFDTAMNSKDYTKVEREAIGLAINCLVFTTGKLHLQYVNTITKPKKGSKVKNENKKSDKKK